MSQICYLNHEHIRQWLDTGSRPSCKFHRHIKYREAVLMLENDEAFIIPELGRAVVAYNCLAYVWQSKRSAGFSMLQLGPIRGKKSPTPLCEEARRG